MGARRLLRTIKKYIPLKYKLKFRELQAETKNFRSSFGGKYRCSVCDRRVRTFQPLPELLMENISKYGYPYKEPETCNKQHYFCPFCSASDRDRLYALYIKYYLLTKSDTRIKVIDFAPSASLTHFIRKVITRSGKDVSYCTADLYTEGVDYKVDVTDLSICSENEFDFFICSHVLEHVDDDRKAMHELYRILKPGGQGILMVPIALDLDEIDEDPSITDEAERWRRFGQNDHVRQYSRKGFIGRVKEAGFLVHEYGKEFFSEKVFTKTAITKQSVLYIVEK